MIILFSSFKVEFVLFMVPSCPPDSVKNVSEKFRSTLSIFLSWTHHKAPFFMVSATKKLNGPTTRRIRSKGRANMYTFHVHFGVSQILVRINWHAWNVAEKEMWPYTGKETLVKKKPLDWFIDAEHRRAFYEHFPTKSLDNVKMTYCGLKLKVRKN